MNKKSLIFSSIVAALALLTVILYVVPMLEGYSLVSLGWEGIRLLFAVGLGEAAMMALMMYAPMFLAFVFSIVVLIFAVLSILTACNVIKSEKAAKAFRIVEVVFASFAMSLTFIYAAFYVMQGGYFFILFFVIAVAVLVLTRIDLGVIKKAAKAQNNTAENNTVEG